jgi:hypothetical protein
MKNSNSDSNNAAVPKKRKVLEKEKEKEAEAATEIQLLIKNIERFVFIFLLTVLQAVLKEQVKAKQLKRGVGNYIYEAVKNQCVNKGWIAVSSKK